MPTLTASPAIKGRLVKVTIPSPLHAVHTLVLFAGKPVPPLAIGIDMGRCRRALMPLDPRLPSPKYSSTM
jgi:hypothetical protein